YTPRQNGKASCGYVGLRNMGTTCHVNSLLQQLFVIPVMRFGIMSCDPFFRTEEQIVTQAEPVSPEDNLLYQLQAVFGYLQESEKQFVDA
ncbi:unnamed protein product, partial [Ascophyllum nodosum]